jgi:hypothetical protein
VGTKDRDRKIRANLAALCDDDDGDGGPQQTDSHGRAVPITLAHVRWMECRPSVFWDLPDLMFKRELAERKAEQAHINGRINGAVHPSR